MEYEKEWFHLIGKSQALNFKKNSPKQENRYGISPAINYPKYLAQTNMFDIYQTFL